MPVVNPRHKFIFFANPRTASRATMSWLVDNIPGSYEPKCNRHVGLDHLRKYVPDYPELDSWSFFQTVRHPCDLITSHYCGNVPKERFPTLRDWLLAGAPSPELLVNGTLFWRFIASRFFRFENLQEIPDYFLEITGARETRPMLHNPAHKTHSRKEIHWHAYWGPKERDWALENLQDLERYCYEV